MVNGKSLLTWATASPDMRPSIFTPILVVLLLCAQGGVLAQSSEEGAAKPDAERGRQAYVMCATCHGARGEGMPSVGAPALGGQLPDYIVRQLREFRGDRRGAHVDDVEGNRMRMLSKSIPDEALVADVAAHIATLPAAASDRAVRGVVAAGRKLYQAQCSACHGPAAEGLAGLNAPRLAGLGDHYLLTQLRHFRDGYRTGDGEPTRLMVERIRTTLREEGAMRNLVAYLGSLGGR